MPAIIEAYNQLSVEPDVLFVEGDGVAHPRGLGIASHLGVVLKVPAIGVVDRLHCGQVNERKVMVLGEVRGFEVVTREFAKPGDVAPGQMVRVESAGKVVRERMVQPHKMPEPIHLANKMGRKMK